MPSTTRKQFLGSLFTAAAIIAAPIALTSEPAAPAPRPQAASVVFSSDFEGGIIDKALWGISGNAPTITTEQKRAGKYAMKTVLDRKKSATSYRTEVTTGGRDHVTPGEDYWYGFSVYLPDDYVTDDTWEIVAQWHSTPDPSEKDAALNPPLSLQTDNGLWMVSTIWDSKPTTDKKNYDGKKMYTLQKYATGRWTDWVFHVKWSPKQDGLLQVWQDGKKVVDVPGPIGFNDQVGPYFKMGIYKGWADRNAPPGTPTTRTLYHDELRIAGPTGKYEDVAPGGGGPVIRPASPVGFRLETQ